MPDRLARRALPIGELLRTGEAVLRAQGLRVRSPLTQQCLLVAALTDLDGTANDEHVPEYARLATVGPARDAFGILAQSGIVTGICTARSLGEAREYRDALGVTGPLIAENGAVIAFPDGSLRVLGDRNELETAVRMIAAKLGRRVPTSLNLADLEAAWEQEQQGQAPPLLGHVDRDSLRRAAARVASCFLVGLSPSEKEVAGAVAAEMGLGCFGELLHLIPRGADKGHALALLTDALRCSTVPPEAPADVVAMIVFGNGENDLPLFEQALRSGGAAVLVGDARSAHGFHFDSRRHALPVGIITLPAISHGHGIRQSLPLLADFFADRYGIHFPWQASPGMERDSTG